MTRQADNAAEALNVAVIGLGHWGPNLVRNFAEMRGANLHSVSDILKEPLAKMGKRNDLKRDYEINVSGEVTAAIAMAIYLNRDLHDTESDVLTIRKISKDYSPWNSKIYGMRYFRR